MKRALSRPQADALLRAAGLLPLAARDSFLDAVDNQLCSLRRHVSDADVSAAITSALSMLNVTTSHFMCDQEVPMPKYLKFDRNGAPIEDDDDILRDGQRLVVPMNIVPRVMTTDQAQAIKDAAYNAMVRELENAWRK